MRDPAKTAVIPPSSRAFFRVVLLGLILLSCPPLFSSESASSSAAPDPRISKKLLDAARKQVAQGTLYKETADTLKYPGGDVPAGIGVCTDMVIRAFRAIGVDLQKELHEDRVAHPEAYPTQIWDQKRADASIDHRRCQNLTVWFKRYALSLQTSLDAAALESSWRGGDVVFFVRKGADHPWHVAIVSDRKAADRMPLVIDLFPPRASESHRLDEFGPIFSHFRWSKSQNAHNTPNTNDQKEETP